MTSARVFIHPRCFAGPAFAALAATLQERGLDVSRVVAGPLDKRGRCELMRTIDEAGGILTLERFDGSRFTHRTGQPAPEPSAA